MSILEHSDHRKAGRAVVIVSTMYILLDQCVAPFSQIDLLGLSVQISSTEFQAMLYAYSALFLIRLYQSGLVSKGLKIRASNTRDLAELEAHLIEQLHSDITEVRVDEDQAIVTAPHEPKTAYDPKPQNETERQIQLEKEFERLVAGSRARQHIVTFVDFISYVVIEVALPVVFFGFAVIPVSGLMVCPGYTAHLDLLSGLP